MRLTALALAISTTGCSFVFVSGPPKNHAQMATFDCSTSRGVPVLDALFTGLELANLGLALYDTDQDWNDTYKNEAPFSRKTGIAIYGVLAALGAAGSYYGFTRTTACRDARAGMAHLPPPAVPGWPPPALPAPTPAPEPAPAPTPPGEPAPVPDQPVPSP